MPVAWHTHDEGDSSLGLILRLSDRCGGLGAVFRVGWVKVNQDAKRSWKTEKKRQRKASCRQKKDEEDYEWTEHFARVSTSG